MNLFELFVKIGADTSQAEKGMKNTQKNSETLTNKIKVMSVQFEAAQKNVDKLSKEFNESVQKTGAASEETQELAVKLDKAEKEAKQLKDALDSYNSEIEESNRKTKELSEKLGKGLATAVKVVDAAIVGLGTAAINSYSQFEQLAGGAAKIFNEMSQTKILEDANNAYRELGLSANQYLAVINDVGATFAATMGDKAGYEAAKTGLKAISDYASGTGKNVDELSQKFTLITRSTSSYQSIADQFSGILPATSKDFLKQAQAVGILSNSYEQLTDVPIAEYQAAVSKMLEKGVADLGLANNTVLESKTTISGSFAAMKAAADNFLVALVDDNADVGQSFKVLAGSVGSFLDNVIPKIWDFIGALGPIGPLLIGITSSLVAFKAAMAISKIINLATAAFQAYKLANEGATIAQWAMNAAMNANPFVLIATLVAGLVAAIITLWNTNEGFRNALINAWNAIGSAAKSIFSAVANFFTKTIPNAFNSVLDWFKGVGGWFADIGKNIVDGIRRGISDAWNNLVKWFKNLFGDLIGIAKKILGIASPSKVFKKIGGFTAEGFGVGFEDEFARVKDDMEDALNFDDASVGINASIRKGGAGAVGGAFGGTSIGNININIDGAKYSDEQSLASAIALEIQNMTDRRAAVYA